MNYMSNSDLLACHTIIHSASAAAATVGAGLAWLPCSDAPVISGVQISMAIGLAKVFGIHMTDAAASAAVAAAAATAAGRAVSQVLVFWLPVVRFAVNATTAAGLTEYVGWALAEDFAKQAYQASAHTAC